MLTTVLCKVIAALLLFGNSVVAQNPLQDPIEPIRSSIVNIKKDGVESCPVNYQEPEIIEHYQTIDRLMKKGLSVENPASSCSDIPRVYPSGYYWFKGYKDNSPVFTRKYCDMNRTCVANCSDEVRWMRVADIDMTDPNQQCPSGFRLVNRVTSPQRICGRYGSGCTTTMFPVDGVEYSRVCGRVIGYQSGTPDGWGNYVKSYLNSDTYLNFPYLDGISLTHGFPRNHIWTFVGTLDETRNDQFGCPCTRPDLTYTGTIPPLVGQDYFCETATQADVQPFYSEDPLWDGQGCGSVSTCCSFHNPPWFCKQLPQPSRDNIELRICANNGPTKEDTPIEIVEIYIQ